MFDFAQFPYDFATGRLVVGGEPLVIHCHHYNCFLQRSIRDAEYIDSAPFLVGAAAEVAFAQLTELLSATQDIPARKATVEALYRACGLGLIDLGRLTERGGEVRTRSNSLFDRVEGEIRHLAHPGRVFHDRLPGRGIGCDLRPAACRIAGAPDRLPQYRGGGGRFRAGPRPSELHDVRAAAQHRAEPGR